jgi:hypothetical protein
MRFVIQSYLYYFMKKFLVALLVVINIFVLFGLSGLVFYQFKQILDRNNQIDNLGNQLVQLKNGKSVVKAGQASALSISSLQIKDEAQTALFDVLKKNTDNLATVKVFFIKKSEIAPNPISLSFVERLTNRKDVVTFVIDELIKGPNTTEQSQKIYTPIVLSGSSNCGNGDFSTIVSGDKITIKFCKALTTSNAENVNIKEVLETTLKQFSGIQKVVILNSNNTCFGDTTGQDLCKNI